jgi:uncharacterized protein GlcG (DUF336 family)
MKTIEELVGEVAKNLGAGKSAPKKQAEPVKPNPLKTEEKAVQTTVTENINFKMTLSTAKELSKAVEIAAGIIGINAVIAVRDEGANLILLHAMDDSYIASIQVAQDKAYTAVALKMPTHIALEQARGGSLDGLTNGNGIMLLGGGYPLKKGNKIYGGIGVSGGTKEQDTLLAAVAAAYFEARF